MSEAEKPADAAPPASDRPEAVEAAPSEKPLPVEASPNLEQRREFAEESVTMTLTEKNE
jgi:hypothetical protein